MVCLARVAAGDKGITISFKLFPTRWDAGITALPPSARAGKVRAYPRCRNKRSGGSGVIRGLIHIPAGLLDGDNFSHRTLARFQDSI